jgi:chitinase
LKKSLRRALWAGAVVAVAAAAVPMVQAAAAGSVTAVFSSDSDWGTGHQGKVTVANGTASAIATWSIAFTLPSGTSISSSWDADVVKTGDNYVATKKSWAGPLAAGASTSFGYIGTGGFKAPTACTINGASCSGGGTVPTTPPPTSAKPPTSAPPTSTPPTSKPPTSAPPTSNPPTSAPPTGNPPNPGTKWVVGYFAQWGTYARNYQVKNIDTSGSATKVTHILYSFANTTGGQCSMNDDTYADRDKAFTADQSVDGVADTWDQPLRGNFNQLLKLKKKYPSLKVLLSVGGWSYGKGFPAAAANPGGFADSCYNLIKDPRWAGLFDGLDVDWEFPMGCSGDDNFCDTTSGYSGYKNLMVALRQKFGSMLVTSAITADAGANSKLDLADYAGGIAQLDKVFVMTYDFFGGFSPNGPTAPHSPLTSYPGIPTAGFNSDAAIQKLKGKGVPAAKMLLGIPFYGRGWTGVTQEAPGGTAAGKATGSWEAGVADYKDLKNSKCAGASIKTIAGTAYALCAGGNWWGFDTPATIAGKMTYVRDQGLGGALFWEFNGDTPNGELITAIHNGL